VREKRISQASFLVFFFFWSSLLHRLEEVEPFPPRAHRPFSPTPSRQALARELPRADRKQNEHAHARRRGAAALRLEEFIIVVGLDVSSACFVLRRPFCISSPIPRGEGLGPWPSRRPHRL